MPANPARHFYGLLEPIAATIFFAPEASEAFAQLGLYQAAAYVMSRAAPMGKVTAATVTAAFYAFHPDMIRENLRWDVASPEDVLATRFRVASDVLRRLLAPIEDLEIDRAARIAGEVARGVNTDGRPLAAAHAALDTPADDLAALWHAAMVLREHRGDGHVAVLVSHGISAAEALVLDAAYNALKPEKYFSFRRFPPSHMAEAHERLRAKAYIDAAGALTDGGAKFRSMIEVETDRLAAPPFAALTPADRRDLAQLLEPVTARICERRGVPRFVAALADPAFPNGRT